ncbi:hypothetical protein [Bacteroides hominis]
MRLKKSDQATASHCNRSTTARKRSDKLVSMQVVGWNMPAICYFLYAILMWQRVMYVIFPAVSHGL